VPSGSERIDHESSAKLAIMVAIVMTEGHKRVKPSDCFIEKAQTTSSKPATPSESQATTASRIKPPGRPGLETLEGGGRGLAWPT
jgi:hypothetical protein